MNTVRNNIESGVYCNQKQWKTEAWEDEEINLKLKFRSDLENQYDTAFLPVEVRDNLFTLAYRGFNPFGSARNLLLAAREYSELASVVRLAYLTGVAKK